MPDDFDKEVRQRFARDEHSKVVKLENVRKRLAAATPKSQQQPSPKLKLPQFEPRALIAAALLLLCLLGLLQGWGA